MSNDELSSTMATHRVTPGWSECHAQTVRLAHAHGGHASNDLREGVF